MSLSDDVSSLFPGHQYVEKFAEPLDDDYEEETTYVTLDLGSSDPALTAGATSFSLIGLDSDTPMLQLGTVIFKGVYENLLGSELLLQEATSNERRKSKTSFLALASERRIRFHEVTLVPKGETVEGEDPHTGDLEDPEHMYSTDASQPDTDSVARMDVDGPSDSALGILAPVRGRGRGRGRGGGRPRGSTSGRARGRGRGRGAQATAE